MTSFSPDFEPEVATRNSSSRPSSLAPKEPSCGFRFSEMSIAAEHLEDVDDRVAGGPVEWLGGVQDAVDPVADRELLGGRLEVDVGRAAEDGVVDQLLGRHERPRLLGLSDPVGVFLGRALALADEDDRRPGPVDGGLTPVEDRPHPSLS